MSDKKLSSSLNKRLSRARESLLQSLSKTHKTKDEEFEACFKCFTTHQNSVIKYQREIKDYYEAVKRVKMNSKLLMRAIWDMYDPSWEECDQIQVKSDALESTFQTYLEAFKTRVIDPIESYVFKINEMNEKIAKRDKKRLDYDAGKRKLQRRESAKTRDTNKIEKANKETDELQSIYELINADLIEELCNFYDNRVKFVSQNLQSLYGAKAIFHSDCSVMFTQLMDAMQSLNKSEFRNTLRDTFSSKNDRSSGSSRSSSSRPSSPELGGITEMPIPQSQRKPRPSDAFERVADSEKTSENIPSSSDKGKEELILSENSETQNKGEKAEEMSQQPQQTLNPISPDKRVAGNTEAEDQATNEAEQNLNQKESVKGGTITNVPPSYEESEKKN